VLIAPSLKIREYCRISGFGGGGGGGGAIGHVRIESAVRVFDGEQVEMVPVRQEFVIAQFVPNPEEDQDTDGQAGGQAEEVDQGAVLLPFEFAHRDL
jgi:hypothetical protein